MYQVHNVLTGAAMPVLSDNPYDLAGPLGERITAQKKDEAGNLLYILDALTGEETTEPDMIVIIDETEAIAVPRPPVMIDAGPLYEWREVVPTAQEQAAEVQRSLVNAVQAYLDAKAREKGYDGILSAASYAGLPEGEPFQAEGLVYAKWRSAVWTYCYAQLDAVTAGAKAVPTAAELIAELPALEL